MYGLSQPPCWETLRLDVLRSTKVAMMGFEPTSHTTSVGGSCRLPIEPAGIFFSYSRHIFANAAKLAYTHYDKTIHILGGICEKKTEISDSETLLVDSPHCVEQLNGTILMKRSGCQYTNRWGTKWKTYGFRFDFGGGWSLPVIRPLIIVFFFIKNESK